MVGLALGMIVATALLVLFANTSAGGKNVQRTSEQIENGRYLSEYLNEELRLAGFYGELSLAGAAYSTPDPCNTTPTGFSNAPLTVAVPLRGYAPTEALSCLSARDRLAGTEAIVLRRLDTSTVAPGTIVGGNSQYYLQNSFCVDDSTTTPMVFDKTAAQFTLRNRSCGAANAVRAYLSRIYYVASCNVCGAGGDTIPTFKRLEIIGNQLVETALVDGIETFRVEYGIDTDNNGSPDTYRTTLAATGPESLWENVVAVKVHFIARSIERSTGGNIAGAQTFSLGAVGTVSTASDGYVRRAYSMTIRLVNPSGAREAQ